MKNPEIYYTYLKDLFKQGFKFSRYQNLPVALRVIMFILLLPVFLLGMISSLYYVIFYGVYRLVKAPAEYIMNFVRGEGEAVKSPAQLVIYLIGFPIAIVFELASLVVWLALCITFLDISIAFSIFTLGSTNFYPFLFNQKERVEVKPYKKPIMNFIINTIIILIFVTLGILNALDMKENYYDVTIFALIQAFMTIAIIGYLVVPFEKVDIRRKNKNELENKETEKEEEKENQVDPANENVEEVALKDQKECPKRKRQRLITILLTSIVSLILIVGIVLVVLHMTKQKTYDTPEDVTYETLGVFEFYKKDKRIYDLKCTEKTVAIVDLRDYFQGYEVISLGEDAFKNCSYLTRIYFPNELKRIKSFAFSNCTSLENPMLPNELEIIDDGAFYQTDFETVTIPKSVKVMGEFVFGNNYSLSIIQCEAKSKPSNWNENWDMLDSNFKHTVEFKK